MKTCCVCGEILPDMTLRRSKFATCNKLECRKEARKRQQAEHKLAVKNNKINPSPKRVIGIENMKKELDTREKYAKANYGQHGIHVVARTYGILDTDVTQYAKELFAGLTHKEKLRIRKEALIKKEIKEFKRVKVPIQVYKITDSAAIEKEIKEFKFGDPPRYDGLKHIRTEFANELTVPFNWSFTKEVSEVF